MKRLGNARLQVLKGIVGTIVGIPKRRASVLSGVEQIVFGFVPASSKTDGAEDFGPAMVSLPGR